MSTNESIRVELGSRSYHISIQSGLLSGAANSLLEYAGACRIAIVTHPELMQDYVSPLLQRLKDSGSQPVLSLIPAGESHKTLDTVQKLYTMWASEKLDRKTLVVVVGGGVLGDVAGFAAASYLRGVRFVQIPTTLLAQVDASIGGKTGVDLPEGKNLVGAFHQPTAVLIDPDTLRTLPGRELISGLAEVIKYGIIRDSHFFNWLEVHISSILERDPELLSIAIKNCCKIKADVVSSDETEQGERAILNFGHTLGHAYESITEYKCYLHGEAVAIGMVAACFIGEEIGVTNPDITERLGILLKKAGLPTAPFTRIDSSTLIAAAQHDKKAIAGKLKWVLIPEVGQTLVTNSVKEAAITAAIERLGTV